MFKKIKKLLVYAVASVMTLTSFIQPAAAAMIGTDQMMAAQARSAHHAKIADALGRPEVLAGLEQYGVSWADAEARVAALTDAEAAELAGRIDALPAGGDALSILGAIVLILIITDLIGVTHVFPFIRPIMSSGDSGDRNRN